MKVQGAGCRVQGAGCRVPGAGLNQPVGGQVVELSSVNCLLQTETLPTAAAAAYCRLKNCQPPLPLPKRLISRDTVKFYLAGCQRMRQ